jgi:pimeloyl-ACP methyl ester carboxylesterase
MPFLTTAGGARLHYEEAGSGPPVILVAGTGARGRTWHLHQVPALVAAGHRVLTLDNRGIAPSDPAPAGMTVATLVGDVAALVEGLGLGPCRLVGSSLGALVVQELLLVRPELVRQAVLMATRARPDAFSQALSAAERILADSAVRLPPEYDAVVRALQNLSPRTLADERAVRDWLDVFELSAPAPGDTGLRAQLELDLVTDRRAAYRGIRVPCLAVAFADDLVAPPARVREFADTVPGCRYVEIPGAGHYGYLERPEAVNSALLDFFAAHPDHPSEESR